MTHLTEEQPAPDRPEVRPPIHLPAVCEELLESAGQASSGRAARTLTPGAGAVLKQTLMALLEGRALADHESPGAATLQVLLGAVTLTGGTEDLELRAGDHVAIPPVRHGLRATDDAVVLISVGGSPRSGGPEESARA